MLTECFVFQEMRKTCKLSSHKSHVSRLLFILTRCSRLVLSGEQCHLFLDCTRASEVVYVQSHPRHGTAGTSLYHCCRGAITSVKQHGNVWYATAQQDTPEAAALLRFSLH